MRQRGTLRLDHRTWRLQLRKKDPSGATVRTWVRIGTLDEMPTRAAARRAADRYLEKLDPRDVNPGTVMRWVEYCDRYIDRWLAMHAEGTRATQASIINLHLRPAFAELAVHEITPDRVQDFVVEQRRAEVAPATIDARFRVLRTMLRQAMAEGLFARPPSARAVRLPKDESVHDVVRSKAFTDEEFLQIVNAADLRDATAYMLGRYIGLRASEIVGLSWSLVDLERGTVTVRQQALDGELRPLKTTGSEAVLQAPAVLLEQLKAYRRAWIPNEGQFLFADPDGRPEDTTELRERLHWLLGTLGLPRRGLHGFRHACALGMADAGCSPEVIRRAMRHSSLRVTAIYLHAAPEDIAAGLARGARSGA